jgi:hypothetical protein
MKLTDFLHKKFIKEKQKSLNPRLAEVQWVEIPQQFSTDISICLLNCICSADQMENRGHITSRTNNFVTILGEDFVLYRHVEFGK